jgi:exodeoxyribonuclease V alpha subunit
MSKDNILLPCRVLRRRYSAANFSVLDVEIDEMSDNFPSDPMAVPQEWIRGGKGHFTVQVSTDFEAEFDELRTYVFSGEVNDHVRYGLQFKADYFFPDMPTSEKMIKQYLDTMRHIGPWRAKMIIDRFGEARVIDIFNDSPEMLLEIRGITQDRLNLIVEAWEKGKAMRDIFVWLCKYDVPVSYASKIVDLLGDKAVVKIQENPYILTAIRGMGFNTVDALAHRVLEEVPGDLRVLHGTRFVMGEALNQGHLCVPSANLEPVVKSYLAEFKEQEDFQSHYTSALQSHFVLIRNEGRVFVYLPHIFAKERAVAAGLVNFVSNESQYSVDDSDIEYAENELVTHLDRDISLDALQSEAVKSAFSNKLTVISGGGGTGKSTICRCIHTICMKKGLCTAFLTPTGAAAKVLGEKTSSGAMTIHRALGMVPGRGPDPDKVIDANIVVIDEFSMVGIDTLPYLIEAITSPRVTNIVFVGDPQQLPSVSAGSFLSDVKNSGIAHVVTLDRIHRQSETSYIPVIADDMSNGQYRGIPDDATDVSLTSVADDAAALSRVNHMVSEYMRVNGSLDGLQVLSPMYKGYAGVDSLCSSIQVMVNSGNEDVLVYKNKTFYVGDRVMHTVNNYEKDVYNGNIGYVVEMGAKRIKDSDANESKYLVVDYDGHVVEYVEKEMDEVRVCWCCTVHKYQGSQVDNVILVTTFAHARMMSRELIYTGMTRASKNLSIVGVDKMLHKASSVSVIRKRFTHTSEMMRRVHSGDYNGFDVKNRHLCC